MKEEFEVTDNGIGPVPAFLHSSWSRNVDPTLTCSPHTMVDVNTKWQLG